MISRSPVKISGIQVPGTNDPLAVLILLVGILSNVVQVTDQVLMKSPSGQGMSVATTHVMIQVNHDPALSESTVDVKMPKAYHEVIAPFHHIHEKVGVFVQKICERESVITTPVAVSGPLLSTCRVNVTVDHQV